MAGPSQETPGMRLLASGTLAVAGVLVVVFGLTGRAGSPFWSAAQVVAGLVVALVGVRRSIPLVRQVRDHHDE